MNRIRMTVLAGVLTIGGLGLIASPAHAQAPGGAAPASAPRYYYGWGYNGWGYYTYPPVPSVPARGGYFSSPAPARSSPAARTTPSTYHEFGTGRNVYLAKPWLQPLR